MDLDPEELVFHQNRKLGIGSTDSPAILGISPWRTAHDVWRSKVMDEEPREPSLPMWLGTRLQSTIAELYTASTGIQVVEDPEQYQIGTVLRAHLDYRHAGLNSTAPIVEIKTARSKKGWGEPLTAEVPKYYWVQVQHQMACVPEVEYADIAVLFGHQDFRVYRIPRDQYFIGGLRTDMEEWWRLYVETKTPPPMDGSEGANDLIRKLYPTETKDVIPATADHAAIVRELFNIREAKAAILRTEELTTQRLKEIIGEHAGMVGSGFKITWKQNNGRAQTEWKEVSRDLMALLDVNWEDNNVKSIVAQHSQFKTGARPFILEVVEDE